MGRAPTIRSTPEKYVIRDSSQRQYTTVHGPIKTSRQRRRYARLNRRCHLYSHRHTHLHNHHLTQIDQRHQLLTTTVLMEAQEGIAQSSMQPGGQTQTGFLTDILTPGSSLRPEFLLILDAAFTALLCVFVVLLFLTRGSIHIFVLIGIEGCLWASVKWCVLRRGWLLQKLIT